MKDEGKKKATDATEIVEKEAWGIDSEINSLMGISGLFKLGIESPNGTVEGSTLGYLSILIDGILKKMQGHVDAIFEALGEVPVNRTEKDKTAPAASPAKG